MVCFAERKSAAYLQLVVLRMMTRAATLINGIASPFKAPEYRLLLSDDRIDLSARGSAKEMSQRIFENRDHIINILRLDREAILGVPTDGGELVEYLWGGCDTKLGGLRCRDGHPQPYQTERVTIEIGNERLTAVPGIWCEDPQRGNTKGDCVQAVLTFARSAAKKARELGPHFAKDLTMVLPFTPPFDAEDERWALDVDIDGV